MSREQLAEKINWLMIQYDLGLKEVAMMTGRCVNTIQRIRHKEYSGYKYPVSDETILKLSEKVSRPIVRGKHGYEFTMVDIVQ